GGEADREEESVAGPHAQRPIGSGHRHVERGLVDGALLLQSAAEQRFEQAARPLRLRRRRLPVLRPAVILRELRNELAALQVAIEVRAAAAQIAEFGNHALEIVAHAADLVVERVALRRPRVAEDEESSARVAAEPLRLHDRLVEFKTLALDRVFVAPRL